MTPNRPAFLDIPPLQSAHGTVQLPGSKSISNRVLLLAGLCSGTTTLAGVLDSDDTRVMLAALQKIGCELERHDISTVTITGIGAQLPPGVAQQSDAPLELFLGNAGTAMRPLTAALAMLGGHFLLTGVPRMYERPIGDLVDGLAQLGCDVQYAGHAGYPPLRIAPRRMQPNPEAQTINVRGDVSSQFLTALLLAAPLAGHALTIQVEGELISKPYIDITLKLMQRFGVAVQRDDETGWQRFTIAVGARYQSPDTLHVEADASSASYFIALGALAADAAQVPVRIEDPACVGKTFPAYFQEFFRVCQTDAAHIPVICIDGPSASGKGTLAAALARQLGYHWLDSGALYRITALAAQRAGLALELHNEMAIAVLAATLPVRFDTDEQGEQQVWLGSDNVSADIRTAQAGVDASKVSVLPEVRRALLALQQGFRRLPGLVADGRDMGTVVFAQAPLKVFLTANAEERAQRRYKQLISQGFSANMDDLRADLQARDARDRNRSIAPLQPAPDAMLLDNSAMDIAASVRQVLQWWQGKQPFAAHE